MNPELLTNTDQLGSSHLQQLDELIEHYPFCATYRLLRSIALANVHSTSLNESVKQTAVFLSDRTSLFHHICNGEYEWETLYKIIQENRNKKTDATDDFLLIDQYLDHMHLSESGDSISGYDLSEIETPAQEITSQEDYDLGNLDEGPVAEDDTLTLIDSFLTAEAEGQLFTPVALPDNKENASTEELEKIRDRAILSESLAKVYVKQHKYEQALAIFSSLNLQYSKKNSYFADQIRFLEKVISYQKESQSEK